MGHTHPNDPSSVIVDEASIRWVQTQDTAMLTGISNADLFSSGHDGWSGLLLLDAMLKAAPFGWQSQLLDYYLPEGILRYGPSCMTATFLPLNGKDQA